MTITVFKIEFTEEWSVKCCEGVNLEGSWGGVWRKDSWFQVVACYKPQLGFQPKIELKLHLYFLFKWDNTYVFPDVFPMLR